jgi:hypothetical protein
MKTTTKSGRTIVGYVVREGRVRGRGGYVFIDPDGGWTESRPQHLARRWSVKNRHRAAYTAGMSGGRVVTLVLPLAEPVPAVACNPMPAEPAVATFFPVARNPELPAVLRQPTPGDLVGEPHVTSDISTVLGCVATNLGITLTTTDPEEQAVEVNQAAYRIRLQNEKLCEERAEIVKVHDLLMDAPTLSSSAMGVSEHVQALIQEYGIVKAELKAANDQVERLATRLLRGRGARAGGAPHVGGRRRRDSGAKA